MNYSKNLCTQYLNQIPTKLRGKYISLLKNGNVSNKVVFKEIEALIDQVKANNLPKIAYPDLPVADKVADIKGLIRENQVVVVAGETGSGKSTQLPKICLDLGLGRRGLIGHTQPRRLAARSIASRVASEIGDQSRVSYKIRFSDQTSESTLVKVMTDGVLLSEIKNDRFLSKYEAIIIDEAHERSLNIDFLLGCIKKILPFRPDLKIIITSATIDHQKFIKYFDTAKDITVSGRTYPVKISYQNDEDFSDFSLQERILYAIDDLGRGDILVFLPTERDIHETLAYLNKQDLRFTEVLPLFSRLSNKDQNKIFNPEGSVRRIILATNVAETSLTVPRIKYVIDSGLARVSRYSYRTKVQRLPIEKISQASANQRAGRCGRLSAGVCVRLYSEEDFSSRKKFTDPEILRTNLASVILQMLFLKLGNIQDFPFIDPPDVRFVKDGYKLLFELQAISELNYSKPNITADGLKMAMMPLDPKLAKIVIEGYRQGCLKEVVSIVSFLSVQDPRERPLSFQQKADEKHSVDKDKASDFIAILNLATRLSVDLKNLSNREKKEYFKKNFISAIRFNEWNDVYRQVIEVVHGLKWKLSSSIELNYEGLHKAIASGFLSNIGQLNDNAEYMGARALKFFIFPGSSQFKKKPKWLLASEIVETTKTYARNVAKIEPEWLENLAKHLIKKKYDEPIWSKKRSSVVANQRITLYGLEIVAKRSIQYSNVDIECAREIFIREALVNGEFETEAYFYKQNLKLIDKVEELEHKSRRRDILVDEQVMFEHYDSFIPRDVCCGVSFDKWLRKISKEEQQKFVYDPDKLMQHDAKNITQQKYPDILSVGNMNLPLEYHFDPLDEKDGATVTLPLAFLNDITPAIIEWGVYGFLHDKIVALLRALPKNIRKNCVPVPTYAQAIFESLEFEKDRNNPLKVVIAKHITRLIGFIVDETVWQNIELENYLILNIKVIDKKGKVLAVSKDIEELKQKLNNLIQKPSKVVESKIFYDWDFADIKRISQIKEYGISVKVYNCIELYKEGVKISYKATQQEAQSTMKRALLRLVELRLQGKLKQNFNKNDLASLSTSLKMSQSKDMLIARAIELSFFRDVELPYTKDEFEKFYNIGITSFEATKQELESLLVDVYKYKTQLENKLNIKKIPLNYIQLFSDVRKELSELFPSDFLSFPIVYLQRYKYYIQALENRLEKAKVNINRDKGYQIEADELKSKLEKKIAANHLEKKSENFTDVYFLIKELWISWYLQNVKTIQSVSQKKIMANINQI